MDVVKWVKILKAVEGTLEEVQLPQCDADGDILWDIIALEFKSGSEVNT